MATLVSRVKVSFLTPSGRTNFSAREGWFMATVLRSCAGASGENPAVFGLPLQTGSLQLARDFTIWLTPCAAYTTLSEAHAHGEGLHAHIPQMSHEGVSDDGPGAKDSPGKVDERRAARSASKRKPRDDPTPGEKGDAAGRENDAGSTPQKVLKKVPMNSPGGTVTANAEECLAVVNLGGNGHAVGEAVADAGRVERSKHPAVADDRRWLGPKGTINRTEYVALIEQALCRMGYDDVAASLRERTGVSHRTEAGAAFERLVLTGRWSEAVESLFVLAREANARAVDPTPDAATEMEATEMGGTATATAMEMAMETAMARAAGRLTRWTRRPTGRS